MEEVTELENQVDQAEVSEEITEEVEQPKERLFTQEEVNAIVKKRALREAKKLTPTVPIVTSDKPRMKEGEAVEDYTERLIDWKESQRKAEKHRESSEREAASFAERAEKAYKQAEKIPDFDREIFDTYLEDYEGDIAKEAIRALVESDVNAQLMAYMTANPKEFETLAELSPARQAAYIGKLETKLEKQTKRVLPEPPEREKGAGNTANLFKTAPDKMPVNDWYAEKQRERQSKYRT